MKITIPASLVGSCATLLVAFATADAQQNPRIAAKSGETIELFDVYSQVNCRSILLATPEVEVLDGPPELTLTVKEKMVSVPRFDCPNKQKGGVVLAAVGNVQRPIEGKLTFRVKFKTKVSSNTQQAYTYSYSLFP